MNYTSPIPFSVRRGDFGSLRSQLVEGLALGRPDGNP